MRRAFTLIELLVTVALVVLLTGILLPSLASARRDGKAAACLSNLRQLGLATGMYLDDNRDHFWRYYVAAPGGIRWWFGFEPGGPAYSRCNRPLDKRQGALSPYLRSVDDALQCPEFPYDSACYFPKFAARSASYGFNLRLGPANTKTPTKRRADYAGRTSGVFVFADGAHFDFNPGMNEGHYIDYAADVSNPALGGGFGHFRHVRRAAVLYVDAHAEPQPLRGPPYARPACGGPAGNLTSPSGTNGIYGF